jgi:hypothetical protein
LRASSSKIPVPFFLSWTNSPIVCSCTQCVSCLVIRVKSITAFSCLTNKVILYKLNPA